MRSLILAIRVLRTQLGIPRKVRNRRRPRLPYLHSYLVTFNGEPRRFSKESC